MKKPKRFIEGDRLQTHEGITFEQLEESIGSKKNYNYTKRPRKKGTIVDLQEATRRYKEKDFNLD